MDAKLDQILCKKYPLLFADRTKSMQETAMCWGFECGNGWYDLIDKYACKLEKLIAAHEDNFLSDGYTEDTKHLFHSMGTPRASQVKEKFGTLQIYLTHGTEVMHEVCSEAERESLITCEECGAKGILRNYGWLKVLCLRHWKALKKERGLR